MLISNNTERRVDTKKEITADEALRSAHLIQMKDKHFKRKLVVRREPFFHFALSQFIYRSLHYLVFAFKGELVAITKTPNTV